MIKFVVKKFNLGDVEDPDIYFGAAWYDFAQTEKGQWIEKHARNLTYHHTVVMDSYGYGYYVTGEFEDEDAMIYKLKWGGEQM